MKGWQEQCPECGDTNGHRSYCLRGRIEAEAQQRFRLNLLRWVLVGIGMWLIIILIARAVLHA